MTVRIARVYDEPVDGGELVLVDRLWPRGVRKDDPRIDRWEKNVAPSTEALATLRTLTRSHKVSLVTATESLDLSHLPVLQELLPGSGG